jgi:hypothetical protein
VRPVEGGGGGVLTKEPEGTTGRPPFHMAPVIVAAVVALSVVVLVARLDLHRDSAPDPTVVSSSADRVVTTLPPVPARAPKPAAVPTTSVAPSSPTPTTVTPTTVVAAAPVASPATSTPPTPTPATPAPAAPNPAAPNPPTSTDGWVQLNETMRTRCAPRGGVRLYLAAGETEPVGLLDDNCPA